MEKFLDLIKEDKDLIEKNLSSIYDEANKFENMCKYAFSVGGKRLRAILLLEAYKSYKEFSEVALDFATAIELIHNYSLVHDDLPEMDDDKYRRGNLSVYGKFGQTNAVLVGDELLNNASFILFNAIGKLENISEIKNALSASKLMLNSSGIKGMILGQFLDLENEIDSIDDLEKINLLKTGALFKASVVGGAMLAGACEYDLTCIENYALSLGLSFQLQDDLFDFDEDTRLNKKTFATILGKDEVILRIKKLNEFAFSEINKISGKKEFFVDFIGYMAKRTY